MGWPLARLHHPTRQRVLAIERDRPDRPLHDVGINLDPAIVEEVDEAVPAAEAIADRLGDRALPGDGRELNFEPGLEAVDERLRPLLAGGMARLGLLAADLDLDGVDRGDARECLAGNRRISGLGNLIEPPPPMRPAEGKLDRTGRSQGAIPRAKTRTLRA